MPENTPRQQLYADAQEERLQRAEDRASELAVKVAENTQQIQFVASEVERGFGRIIEKIDNSLNPLAKQLEEQSHRMTGLAERVSDHRHQFAKMDEEREAHAAKWDSWKKWIATAVTGAVAIGLKELVAFIAHHMP